MHCYKTHVVRIKRKYIFEDGYKELSKIADLRGKMHIVFINELGNVEDGQDAGGLFKEFLTQLIEIVFNPDYGLFITTPVDLELFPNPNSRALFGQEDLNFYRFLGRILGRAVYDGITVNPQFARFFLRKLIGKSNSLNDLESLDHQLFKQLNFLRNYDGDVGDLEMYFSISEENLATGQTKEVNLVPNGSEVKVTNQNKFRYIYMMADYRLNRRIKE